MKESILALLIAIGGTKDLGEESPYLLVGARFDNSSIRIEGSWDTSDKRESPGWRASGKLLFKYQTLFFGGGYYTYRHTEAWNKDAVFLTTGAGNKNLELLISGAVNSPNNEWKAELVVKAWKLELHTLFEFYNMTNDPSDKRFGMGSQLVLVLP